MLLHCQFVRRKSDGSHGSMFHYTQLHRINCRKQQFANFTAQSGQLVPRSLNDDNRSPTLHFRFWGQMTPKVKIFETVFPDSATGHRSIRIVTKFGKNRPLRSCRKVACMVYHTKKLGLRGTRVPHFAQNRPIAPKIP